VEVSKAKPQPGISQCMPDEWPRMSKIPAPQKDSVVDWQNVTRNASHHQGCLFLRNCWRACRVKVKTQSKDPKHDPRRENFHAKDYLRLIRCEAHRRDDQHTDQ
jgi:hypothetical protein